MVDSSNVKVSKRSKNRKLKIPRISTNNVSDISVTSKGHKLPILNGKTPIKNRLFPQK